MSDLLPPPSRAPLLQETGNNHIWMTWLFNVYHEFNDFIPPVSITVNAGGTPVGTVDNVKEHHDGNIYQVPEVAATPGFDIDFNFENVAVVRGIVSHIWYNGSATHDVLLRLRNYSTSADDDFLIIPNSGYYGYRTILIEADYRYVDGTTAQASLYHASAGNASHDIYIDYIALLGKRAK